MGENSPNPVTLIPTLETPQIFCLTQFASTFLLHLLAPSQGLRAARPSLALDQFQPIKKAAAARLDSGEGRRVVRLPHRNL
jgi:hypothetical protein